MTTIDMWTIRCGVCEAPNDVVQLRSTMSIGFPDLDTRPPELARSTITMWAQRCPECGYCAEELGVAPPEAKEIVTEEGYKRELMDPHRCELANTFVCKAIIEERTSKLSEAAWSWIHAAWACDDADQEEQASMCRRKGISTAVMAESMGQSLAEDEGTTAAVVADLLRRSGQMELCRQWLENRAGVLSEGSLAILRQYQLHLIENADTTCHTMWSAEEWNAKNSS